MIKKFQRRFILMAMAALLAVLILIIGGINVYNFHEVAEDPIYERVMSNCIFHTKNRLQTHLI